MADEALVTAKLAFTPSDGTTDELEIIGLKIDVTSKLLLHQKATFTTVFANIDQGGLAAGGLFMGVNRDTANTIQIRAAAGETVLVRIPPGEVCIFRLDAAAASPQAATTLGTAILEYMLLEA